MTKHEKMPRALQTALEAITCRRGLHAYVLEGDGYEPAKLLARALVCEDPAHRPCGGCRHCLKALAGQHPDLITVEGGGSARSFGVDKIRQMKSDAYILPNEAELKVYMLYDSQNMSTAAQNALLKLLEEPPAHAVFLLSCSSAQLLLPTVLSRCALLSTQNRIEPPRAEEYDDFCRCFAENLTGRTLSDFLEMFSFFEKNKEKSAKILDALTKHFAKLAREAAGANCASEPFTHGNPKLSPLKAAEVMALVQLAGSHLDCYANYNLTIIRMLSKSWEEVH